MAAAFSGRHLEFVEKRAYDLNLNYFHKDGKLCGTAAVHWVCSSCSCPNYLMCPYGKESKMSIPDLETYLPKVISWRRDLHMHPELGLQEVRTSNLIADL